MRVQQLSRSFFSLREPVRLTAKVSVRFPASAMALFKYCEVWTLSKDCKKKKKENKKEEEEGAQEEEESFPITVNKTLKWLLSLHIWRRNHSGDDRAALGIVLF